MSLKKSHIFLFISTVFIIAFIGGIFIKRKINKDHLNYQDFLKQQNFLNIHNKKTKDLESSIKKLKSGLVVYKNQKNNLNNQIQNKKENIKKLKEYIQRKDKSIKELKVKSKQIKLKKGKNILAAYTKLKSLISKMNVSESKIIELSRNKDLSNNENVLYKLILKHLDLNNFYKNQEQVIYKYILDKRKQKQKLEFLQQAQEEKIKLKTRIEIELANKNKLLIEIEKLINKFNEQINKKTKELKNLTSNIRIY